MEDTNQNNKLKEKESLFNKLARSGLAFLISGKMASGSKYKGMIQGASAMSTALLLDSDDGIGSDIFAASAIIGSAVLAKKTKNRILNDGELLGKTYNKMKAYDENSKKAMLFMSELPSKVGEIIVDNASKRGSIPAIMSNVDNKNYIRAVTTAASEAIGITGNMIKDSSTFIKNHSFGEIIENLYTTKNMKLYEERYKSVNLEEISKNIDLGGFKINESGTFLDSIVEKFPLFKFLGKSDTDRSNIIHKKMRKYQKIEKNSFFSDILGLYSKHTEGGVEANYESIIKDGANTLETLQKLTATYTKEMGIDGVKKNELTEEHFVKWLKNKNMDYIVDNFYKNNKHIKIGEYSDYILDDKHSIEREETYAIGGSLIKKIFNVNSTNNKIEEIKDINLLKNFSFTEVIEKTNSGITDKTAMNGQILALKMAGILENASEAYYKNPLLSKKIIKWNPLQFIEHKARIKNIVTNDISTLASDGYSILANKTKYNIDFTDLTNLKIDKVEGKSFYIEHRRGIREMFNEKLEIKVDMPQRNETSLKKLYATFKNDGFSGLKKEFLNSHQNPTPFYVDKNNKIKFLKEGGYYNEGPFFKEEKVFNLKRIKHENRRTDSLFNFITQIALEKLYETEDTKNYIQEISKNVTRRKRRNIFDNILAKMTDENIEEAFSKLKGNKYSNKDEYLKYLNSLSKDHQGKEIHNFLIAASSSSDLNFKKNILGSIKDLTKESMTYKNFLQNGDMVGYLVNENNFRNIQSKEFLELQRKIGNKNIYMKKMMGDIIGITQAKEKATKATLEKIIKNGIDKNIVRHKTEMNFTNPGNLYNSMYEIALSFENSKLSANRKSDLFDDLYDLTKKIMTAPNFANKPKQSIDKLLFENKIMSNTYKEGIVSKIKGIFTNGNKFSRVDEFKEMLDDSSLTTKSASHHGVFDFLDSYKKETTRTIGRNTSKIILEKSFDRIKSDKGILQGVKDYINHLISSDGRNTASVFLSKPIKKLQDSLEFIGIQRLPNEIIGENWSSNYLNFFKKRFVPLVALITGATALDSFSDAMVPDEVPIVGGGISGIVAKGYGLGRVGAQYIASTSGVLALGRKIDSLIPGLIDNGFTSWFDPLMDPGEMYDTYFSGKKVRINKNRGWFTSGRLDARGNEFMEHREHLLYTMQHKDTGVYGGKWEKFFRKDFVPTSLLWTAVDPYLEEREAEEKYGAIFPRSAQLFKDIPVIGHLLSATLGEIIKPTKYFKEKQWKSGNSIKNPFYNPNDEMSSEYIEYKPGNRIIKSIFEGIEDLKTFAGMEGYVLDRATKSFFGKTNPYENEITLSSLEDYSGMYHNYDKMQLGDLFGITEPIRRLLDKPNNLGEIKINPTKQITPEWMPEYLQNGDNFFLKTNYGTKYSENIFKESDDLKKLNLLAMAAPHSKEFRELNNKIVTNLNSMSKREKIKYYEILGYSNDTERINLNQNNKAKDVYEKNIKIDKVIGIDEFLSNGKRYKLEGVETNFNKLSNAIGEKKAYHLYEKNREILKEGNSINFKTSTDERFGAGTDDKGNFIRVYSKDMAKGMNKNTAFDVKTRLIKNSIINAAMPSHVEKIFGIKTMQSQWANDSVQGNEFKDWDSPISSFIDPMINYSSNSIISNMAFSKYAEVSSSPIPLMGAINTFSKANLIYNKISGHADVSTEYKEETEIFNKIDSYKNINNLLSSENINTSTHIKNIKETLNNGDRDYFNSLVNTNISSEMDEIEKLGNDRLTRAISLVRTQRQNYIDDSADERQTYHKQNFREELFRLKNKSNNNRLDRKKMAVINAYKSTFREGNYINKKISENYQGKSRGMITSTMAGKGVINITRRRSPYDE